MTIPITVLTGFLGSGKTTLLRNLLQDSRLGRTLVIINEFGEIGIDHELVEASGEDFVQLTTGCLCCNIRSDLLQTLDDMMQRRTTGLVPAFERVIIETSGLADPAPILHALQTDPLVVRDYGLRSIVATADAIHGIGTLREHEQSRRQVASADHLFITKTDLAEAQTAALRDALLALNSRARVHHAGLAALDMMALFDGSYDLASESRKISTWINADADAASPVMRDGRGHGNGHQHGHAHPPDIGSFVLVRDKPLHAVTLSLFLEALVNNCGADMLRVKGLVQLVERPDEPAVIQGVQHVFYPPVWLEAWPSEDRRTRIVFIGKNISSVWASALLELIELEVEDETSRQKSVH